CINHSDKFCYICGQYVLEKQRCDINNAIKVSYFQYFNHEIQH
ncbi:hypothetical protein EAI_06103, partial [Harpegnathos saltator]